MNNLSRKEIRGARITLYEAAKFKFKDFLSESVVEKLNALRKEKDK